MAYVATLTVPAGKISVDLSSFPVRVDLADMPLAWWGGAAVDGANIRVRKANADLPLDVVTIDVTTRTGELFFRADLLSASDNVFTVEIVDGATALAATDPNGRNAVWSDYEAVFIFTGNDPTNRTGNGKELTLNGGIVANGYFRITSGSAAAVSGLTGSQTWTLAESFYKENSWQDTQVMYTGSGYSRHMCDDGYKIATYSNGAWTYTQNYSASTKTWYREVSTHDASNILSVYHTGANRATANRGGVSATTLYVGGSGGTSELFTGRLNRVTLQLTTMSAAWVAAEYASWETPQNFYTATGPSGLALGGDPWASAAVMLGSDPVKVLGELWSGAAGMLDGERIRVALPGEPWGVPAVIPNGSVVARVGGAAWSATAQLDDLGFVDLGPMLALEVLDSDLDRAPTALTVVIVGAPADAPLDFNIDGTLVYSTTADADGYLGPTSLPVGENLLAGAHTIAVDSNGARGATATFTLKRDPSPWPRVVGTDADPVLVPAAQTPSGIYKWVLQDLLPGGLGSFVMPYNPATMTSPHLQRTLTPRTTTSVAAPMFHVTEAAEEAITWEFSGYLDTQAAHDQLVAFGELNRRFYVIDHRNRAWVVTFTSVELTARKRQSHDDGTFNDWAHDYTVRALIYDQDWKVPQ